MTLLLHSTLFYLKEILKSKALIQEEKSQEEKDINCLMEEEILTLKEIDKLIINHMV